MTIIDVRNELMGILQRECKDPKNHPLTINPNYPMCDPHNCKIAGDAVVNTYRCRLAIAICALNDTIDYKQL